ncbi:MAG: pyridoxamine 5'-phosphate oxidase family protein [Candidatus Dadabacteria bacterium]|nr:MAG: pyridoxamine 5'-phosphate oxidase family protein [Candidatus Dadabacteria bacterium]
MTGTAGSPSAGEGSPASRPKEPPANEAGIFTNRSDPGSGCLDARAIRAFEPDAKIALLATVDDGGLPRVTLITSLAAKDATTLTFGQFCEGQSKRNLPLRPQAAFLVMTPDRRLWSGRARWRGRARSGEDYEAYNRRPMFRYNAYFGIHTVHYLDVVSVSPSERVLVVPLVLGAARRAMAARLPRRRRRQGHALSRWAMRFLAAPSTLAFAAFVGEDGWPSIVPLVHAVATGPDRLAVGITGRGRPLKALRAGHPLAVFALNLRMESILVRGRLETARGLPGLRYRPLPVDWVYNSMPPKQGVVYPRARLRPVEQF